MHVAQMMKRAAAFQRVLRRTVDCNNTTPYVVGSENRLVGSPGGLWPVDSDREVPHLQVDPELRAGLTVDDYRRPEIVVVGIGAEIGEKNGLR